MCGNNIILLHKNCNKDINDINFTLFLHFPRYRNIWPCYAVSGSYFKAILCPQNNVHCRGHSAEAGWACQQWEEHPGYNTASLHSQHVRRQNRVAMYTCTQYVYTVLHSILYSRKMYIFIRRTKMLLENIFVAFIFFLTQTTGHTSHIKTASNVLNTCSFTAFIGFHFHSQLSTNGNQSLLQAKICGTYPFYIYYTCTCGYMYWSETIKINAERLSTRQLIVHLKLICVCMSVRLSSVHPYN